jgi:hypothetical protein
LFATISEIAGASNPIYENSYSFKNLLTTATAGKREYNYSEILGEIPNKSGYTIRNKKYKYIHFDSGQERFFNLLSDPYENENLLTGVLSDEENLALQQLVEKANEIRQ